MTVDDLPNNPYGYPSIRPKGISDETFKDFMSDLLDLERTHGVLLVVSGILGAVPLLL